VAYVRGEFGDIAEMAALTGGPGLRRLVQGERQWFIIIIIIIIGRFISPTPGTVGLKYKKYRSIYKSD